MMLATLRALANSFYETVTGLRCGQVGRANIYFNELLTLVQQHVQALPAPAQKAAVPVIQQMLNARQRDDAIALADVIEHQLPVLLDGGEIGAELLSIAATDRLRAIDTLIADQAGVEQIRQRALSAPEGDPAIAVVAVCAAMALYHAGRYSDAGVLLRLAGDLGHRSPAAAYYLALVDARAGRIDPACETMSDAYRGAPSLRDGFLQIAWLAAPTASWADALAIARRDQAERRLSLQQHTNLARLYALAGDLTQAVALVEQAYRQDTTLRDGFIALAGIRADAGALTEALEFAQKDHDLDRATPRGMIQHAQLLGRIGQFERAAGLIDDAYSRDPYQRDGFAQLGWIRVEAGHYGDAWQIASRDEAQHRLTPAWTIHLAELCMRLNDEDRAVKLVATAYHEDPLQRDGYARLGWIKAQQRQWNEADTLMQRDLETGRMNTVWLSRCAVVKVYLGDLERALQLVERVYALDEHAHDQFGAIGWHAYLTSGDTGILHRLLQRDREIDRFSSVGRLHQAVRDVLAGLPFQDHAHDVEALVLADAGRRNWLTLLGWAHHVAGDDGRAIDLMARDRALDRMDAAWLPTYAMLLARYGRTKEAVDLLGAIPLVSGTTYPIGFWTQPEALLDGDALRRRVLDESTHA